MCLCVHTYVCICTYVHAYECVCLYMDYSLILIVLGYWLHMKKYIENCYEKIHTAFIFCHFLGIPSFITSLSKNATLYTGHN